MIQSTITPAGSGGGSSNLYAELTSNFDYENQATFVDVMTVAVEANTKYLLKIFTPRISRSVTNYHKLNMPTGASFTGIAANAENGSTARAGVVTGVETTIGMFYGSRPLRIDGVLKIGSTAGNVAFQIRQSAVTVGTNNVESPAYFTLIKIE